MICRGLPSATIAIWSFIIIATTPSVLIGQEENQQDATKGSLLAIAVPIKQKPTIDGILDEPFWENIPPITEFIQRVPVDGGPPSELTEVRIAYDQEAIYFGLKLYDSDPQLIRRSIFHREGRISQDDHVWIGLDTYLDRRNGYLFEMNSFGTQGDALITDETDWNWDWEGVYQSQARITEEGWVLEVAIPFTTIRYSTADAPEMGIAIRRSIRRKNEEVYWPHIPQKFRGGFRHVSQYAILTGLKDLPKGRHMELKPFAIIGGQKKYETQDADVIKDIGIDLKYSITPNITADLTWNTDFAQVEADNVQVNLTRFSLFFPEKREFFLERSGLFSFGDDRDTEIFFSRRLGLSNDIKGGGRITGQVGPISIGALSLQTENAGSGDGLIRGSNNSVIRIRGDIMPRTTVGGLITSIYNGNGYNRVLGTDAQIRFWGGSNLRGWFAKAWDSETGESDAGSVEVNIRPERWFLLGAELNSVDPNFNPGLGFVKRKNMMRYQGEMMWTPAFDNSTWARSLAIGLRASRINGHAGDKQTMAHALPFRLSFQSGERINLTVRREFERIIDPAFISGRKLSPGDYTFTSFSGYISTNSSRTFSGRTSLRIGEFWNGTRTDYSMSASWKTGPYLTLSPSFSRRQINIPVEDGKFSADIFSLNVLGALSRKIFANALVQWDNISEELQANIRIDWIHTPGSDLFIVLNTGYNTNDVLDPRDTRWIQNTGVVKLTYLKAF